MSKKYLRISNRNPDSAKGHFPRRLLKVMGATTNREKTDNDHGASQFGSGKKLSPVAALNLGLEVHLSSHDEAGHYFFTYGTETDYSMGKPQEILTMTGQDGVKEGTDICMHSAKNWGDPIGDDPVREYHVLREYIQDAYSLDPTSYKIKISDLLYPAFSGTTSVYLTLTVGMCHILKNPSRYFKYLSLDPVLFASAGRGKIYPKSEEGVTRIFGRDQLASCSKSMAETSLYDYSLQKLSLMSEDRTFRSMYRVKSELGHLLAALDDTALITNLIKALLEGKGFLESAALQTLANKKSLPDLKAWYDAWHAMYPEKEAVMSSFSHEKDEYARYTCGKEVVKVFDQGLQRILSFAGVKFASAYFPENQKNTEIIVPTPEHKLVLEKALCILEKWGLTHPDFETHVYRPRVGKKEASSDLGYCIPTGPEKGTYILERMLNTLRDTLETGYHEHAHARTGGALDGSRAFDERKDIDMGRLLRILEALLELLKEKGVEEEDVLVMLHHLIHEDEKQVDEIDLSEFDDADTLPGFKSGTDASTATEDALKLIQKMKDGPEPSG